MFVCEKPSRWHCRVYGFCSFGDRSFLFFERSWFHGCGLAVVRITGGTKDKWKADKEVSMKVSVILGHPYEGSFTEREEWLTQARSMVNHYFP